MLVWPHQRDMNCPEDISTLQHHVDRFPSTRAPHQSICLRRHRPAPHIASAVMLARKIAMSNDGKRVKCGPTEHSRADCNSPKRADV